MLSQQQAIATHILGGNSLTPLEAIGVFKAFRLASNVERMRKKGYAVVTTMRRDARGGQYAQYHIPTAGSKVWHNGATFQVHSVDNTTGVLLLWSRPQNYTFRVNCLEVAGV